jgi:uncharacterized protein (DUF342 family)
MYANIRLEPAGENSANITAEDIHAALAAHNVAYGIKQPSVTDLVTRWCAIKRVYEIDRIAIGDPPKPGQQGQPDFKVTCITVQKHFSAVQKAKFCYELRSLGFQFDRVDSGTIIASRKGATPPFPGKNILGEEVKTTDISPAVEKTDNTIDISENGDVFTSKITGIPYFIEQTIGVLPMEFDATIDIHVSSDKMSAELIVNPAMQGGQPPSESAIRDLLTRQQVIHGIKEDFIKELLGQMSAAIYPEDPVIIAQGNKPVNGKDGSIEFLFNTQTSLTPKENPDGSVDFKNVDLIHWVTAGSFLARLLPPENGVPGKDITGREIPGKNGKKAILPKGASTKISDSDETLLVSTIEGNVTYNGRLVEVHEGYVVEGNIDYSTGNVHYEKAVTVKGDVKSGFTVECGGDLEVHGTIEDAQVKTSGTVLCRLGFMGQGKGHIDAKGDVNLTFMKNQTVRARGNVIVAREALNCTIYSRKSISVSGKPLSAAGGTLMARDSIVVREVGNHTGIKTVLDAGTDFSLLEEMVKTDKYLNELVENCRALLKSYKRYDMIIRLKKKLPPKDEFIFTKLRNTLGQVNQQIKTLEKRKKLIQEKLYSFDKAFIKIEYAAMPGTIFKFGDRHMMVNYQIEGPKYVRLIDNEITLI